MATTVQSYACRLKGIDHETTITAKSAGKAKAAYRSQLLDVFDRVEFRDIRVRSLGGPVTSDEFRRNAEYRGVPFAKVGMRVRVGEAMGTIIGHDSSANWRVLFDEDTRYQGGTLSCHPRWEITYYGNGGEVLADFRVLGAKP